jgi:hypothetical protein
MCPSCVPCPFCVALHKLYTSLHLTHLFTEDTIWQFLFIFGGTEVSTQGLTLAEQMFSCLSHISSPQAGLSVFLIALVWLYSFIYLFIYSFIIYYDDFKFWDWTQHLKHMLDRCPSRDFTQVNSLLCMSHIFTMRILYYTLFFSMVLGFELRAAHLPIRCHWLSHPIALFYWRR